MNEPINTKTPGAEESEARIKALYEDLKSQFLTRMRKQPDLDMDEMSDADIMEACQGTESTLRNQAQTAYDKELKKAEEAAAQKKKLMISRMAAASADVLTEMLGPEAVQQATITPIRTKTPDCMLEAKSQHETRFPSIFWVQWATADYWMALRRVLVYFMGTVRTERIALEQENPESPHIKFYLDWTRERQGFMRTLNWILEDAFGIEDPKDATNFAPDNINQEVQTYLGVKENRAELSWFGSEMPSDLIAKAKEHEQAIATGEARKAKHAVKNEDRDAFRAAVAELFLVADIAAPDKLIANVAKKQFGIEKSAIQACRSMAVGKQQAHAQPGGQGIDETALKYARAGKWTEAELVEAIELKLAMLEEEAEKARIAAAKKATDLKACAAGPNVTGKQKKEQQPNQTGKKKKPAASKPAKKK
jgi:hypothetical protein